MTKPQKSFVILLGACFALIFAFYFQYGRGLHPCELCILQRWIYATTALLALISMKDLRLTPLLTIILIAEAGAAFYHMGIEYKWWEGLTACSSGIEQGLTLEQIKAKLNGTPLVRCDEPAWHFAGLSMAGWNVVYSLGLLAFSLVPCRKST